jgi:hypothetical protein
MRRSRDYQEDLACIHLELYPRRLAFICRKAR